MARSRTPKSTETVTGTTPEIKKEEIRLNVTRGTTLEKTDRFITPFVIEPFKGSNKHDGNVTLQEGTIINSANRIGAGKYSQNHEAPLLDAGKMIKLKIVFNDGVETVDNEVVFTLPQTIAQIAEEKAAKEEAAKELAEEKKLREKKADELQVSRHRLIDDKNSLFLRVINIKDEGIKQNVSICVEGAEVKVPTDEDGTAIWTSRKLEPREIIKVDVTTPSIHGIAKVTLRGPRPVDPKRPKAWTRKWWYEVNNGRGVAFLILVIMFWFLAMLIGPGDPLIHFGHKELSNQEIFYSKGADVLNEVKVDPEPSTAHVVSNFAHKMVWALAIFFSIFAPLYFFFSLREEIAEGFAEGLELLVDRPYVQKGDPLAERLLSWAGARSVISNRPSQAQADQKTVEQPTTKVEHVPFWELFRSDLTSDMLVEVIPAMLKHFFR